MGSFTVVASGNPAPTLTESGALPGGISFADHGNGTVAISGTPANGTAGNFNFTITAHNGVGADATQSFTLSIDRATPIIDRATPAAVPYGTSLSSLQLDATASVPGTFVYTPAAGTVLNIGSQTLSVTFTPTDSTDYTTATKSVTLSVGQTTPTITWATPAAITFGTALSSTQLDSTATGAGGASLSGTFVYTPAAGTFPGAGSQTLSVTFTPTDSTDYTSAAMTVTLLVSQITAPSNLTATAAGASQINLSWTASTDNVGAILI